MASNEQLHIFLVRHYKPKIERRGWFNQSRAAQFILDYDLAEIEAIINKPESLPYQEVRCVHCSVMPRAIATAKAIFGSDVQILEDKLFNECERKILALPLLRFPISVWLVGARLLWLMGLNSNGIETYKQSQIRARQCAQKLTQYASEEKKTVLIAHGMLNIFIRKYLKQMGWKVKQKGGNAYLSVTELVKN